jgi:hypothetical protein
MTAKISSAGNCVRKQKELSYTSLFGEGVKEGPHNCLLLGFAREAFNANLK